MREELWKRRKVLVTGHTGFKGAWLTLWLQTLGAEVAGLALAPTDPNGAFEAMGPWSDLDEHVVDLVDRRAVDEIVDAVCPDVVFHLAAQPIVWESLVDPHRTFAVNVMGTLNLLEAIRAQGDAEVVVLVTTDKVYLNEGRGKAFREEDRLGGRDPYSSSKACVELLARAWRETMFASTTTDIVTTRAGNVIGGGDRGRQRLVPDAIRALERRETLSVRNPFATRPWLFVLDALFGYVLAAEALLSGTEIPASLNFGPDEDNVIAVSELIDRLFEQWGAGTWTRSASGFPESETLRLDSNLARKVLSWAPRLDIDEAVRWTVEWYRAQGEGTDMRALSVKQLQSYIRDVP